MVAETRSKHPRQLGTVGLHVGKQNALKHFPQHFAHVELALDHLLIICPLEPSFWQALPEIHDLRLSSWLEAKRSSGKLAAHSASVAMVPCGGCLFRLQLLEHEELESLHSTGFEGVVVSPIASPLELLDRRKREGERHPERRKARDLKLHGTAAKSVKPEDVSLQDLNIGDIIEESIKAR